MPSYRLVDGAPVLEDDIVAWYEWLQESEFDRVVASSSTQCAVVVTWFTGYSPPGVDPPLLYDTRVIGGRKDGATFSYQTRQQAVEGHNWFVSICTYLEEYP